MLHGCVRNPSLFSATCILCWFLGASPGANAHDLWLEPTSGRVAVGTMVNAHIKVGSDMMGEIYGANPARTETLTLILGGEIQHIRSKPGAIPAIAATAGKPGLARITYVSKPSSVTYNSIEELAEFAAEEGLGNLVAQHRARALPESGFIELFSRSVKALIAVGDGAGEDGPSGLPFEIVLDQNPYLAPIGTTLVGRLILRGVPLQAAQVKVFRRDADSQITRKTLLTDQAGQFEFEPEPGFYMLAAVNMAEPKTALAERSGAVWHSLWTSTTFEYSCGVQ